MENRRGRPSWDNKLLPEWKLNRLIETYGHTNKAMMFALLELKQRRGADRHNESKAE